MNIKHGKSKTSLYNRYYLIMDRCYNKNSIGYKRYGGRGIKVCDTWKVDFLSFYNWSMENGYSKNLQIDRIDNNGNYEPNNCRWADFKNQSRNKEYNKIFNGEYSVDASIRLGGSKALVCKRLKRGWSMYDAFNTPIKS